MRSKKFTSRSRIISTICIATITAALGLVALSGINTANAAPNAPRNTANMRIYLCGGTSAGIGQAWVELTRLENAGQMAAQGKTVTVTTAADARKLYIFNKGDRAEDTTFGSDHIGTTGLKVGDWLGIVHNGAVPEYLTPIMTVGTPGMDHPFSQNCKAVGKASTNTGGTGAKTAGTAVKVASVAQPKLTALCAAAGKPITTTGTAGLRVGGSIFVGKLAFYTAPTTTLTVEQALKATDVEERDFTGVPGGTAIVVHSGNLRVFRIMADGSRVYLGDLDARGGKVYDDLTHVNGACQTYDIKLIMAQPGRNGLDLPTYPGNLALGGVLIMVGFCWFGRRQGWFSA